MSEKVPIEVRVNGVAMTAEAEPRRTLADFLREDLGLTGTHVGCEQGVCGACTVLHDGEPVRSCLMFAVQASGSELRTIEGLAGPDGELNELQLAMWDGHGFQCGFCTPGFLMQITALLDEQPDATPTEIREVLSGNVCRCTGYQSIVDAVVRVAADRRAGGGR